VERASSPVVAAGAPSTAASDPRVEPPVAVVARAGEPGKAADPKEHMVLTFMGDDSQYSMVPDGGELYTLVSVPTGQRKKEMDAMTRESQTVVGTTEGFIITLMKDESQYVLEPTDGGKYAMVPMATLVSISEGGPSAGDKRKREELETKLEEWDSLLQADMEWTCNYMRAMRKSSERHVGGYKMIAERLKACYDMACDQVKLIEKIPKSEPA
jgi:hypothetical protein